MGEERIPGQDRRRLKLVEVGKIGVTARRATGSIDQHTRVPAERLTQRRAQLLSAWQS